MFGEGLKYKGAHVTSIILAFCNLKLYTFVLEVFYISLVFPF